jgi:hypothetical protein
MPRKDAMNFGAWARHGLSLPAVFLMGCATTGHASYESMHSDVDRAGAVDRRQENEDESALTGPVLERAAYVRAVLHRNRSV